MNRINIIPPNSHKSYIIEIDGEYRIDIIEGVSVISVKKKDSCSFSREYVLPLTYAIIKL